MLDRSRGARLRRTLALALVPLAAFLSACGGGSDDEPPPGVATTSGRVVGTEGAAMHSYLGIPYAAPPVGELRWKPPVAPAAWSSPRESKAFGPHCPQPATAFGAASASEDCLYLNVFTPATPGPHPVMVWIHGGAFYLGLSNAYDPSRLVAQGTVVVTLNYRLGALGFLAHPALSAEQDGHSGNYALMDQQAALRWVRDNIANFGGDKNNVTIFGESAGGFSVHTHLASAGSAGLFHKAIIMSGGYAFGGQLPLAAAEATSGAAFAGATSCATAECLRALPVSALLAAQATAWPSGPIPVLDGVVLTQPVEATLAAGTHNKVPVLQGTTKDEWRLFVALDEITLIPGHAWKGAPLTPANYETALAGTFPFLASTANLLATYAYPVAAHGGSASLALGALGTDLMFACNGRTSNRLQALAGETVYAYEFADRTAPALLPGVSFEQGAAHSSELQYIFDMRPLTQAQRELGDAMVGYWARFARTGNPNADAAPDAWPAYTLAGDTVLTLAPGAIAPSTTFADEHQCKTTWAPQT